MTLFRWLLPLLLLTACATNPVTKDQEFVLMSEEQELAMGKQMAAIVAQQMVLLPESDPLSQYVNSVGQRVAAVSDRPELFYRFYVVDDKTINAFALAGGYIYIHRGLLAHLNSEAELAAVLGHEIGHVTARHLVKRYTQAQAYNIGMTAAIIGFGLPAETGNLTDLVAFAMIQGYGRDAELQSDELSLKYISRAGYDAKATIALLETLKRLDDLDTREKSDTSGEKVEKYHGAFSSHPEDRVRIEQAVAKYASLQTNGGFINRNAMISHMEGYPFGDSAEQGAVIGRRFIHPDLGIELQFPNDWVIDNAPAALNARMRQQKVFFQLQVKDLNKRQSAAEVLQSLVPARKIVGPITSGTQNGFQTARARVDISAPHVSQASYDVHVFLRGPQAFVMLLWCDRNEFARNLPQFDRIAASFDSYDKQRDGDIPRIHIIIWKAGDSWQQLAADSRQVLGRFTAEHFAAMNGMDVGTSPAPGTLIKVVR